METAPARSASGQQGARMPGGSLFGRRGPANHRQGPALAQNIGGGATRPASGRVFSRAGTAEGVLRRPRKRGAKPAAALDGRRRVEPDRRPAIRPRFSRPGEAAEQKARKRASRARSMSWSGNGRLGTPTPTLPPQGGGRGLSRSCKILPPPPLAGRDGSGWGGASGTMLLRLRVLHICKNRCVLRTRRALEGQWPGPGRQCTTSSIFLASSNSLSVDWPLAGVVLQPHLDRGIGRGVIGSGWCQAASARGRTVCFDHHQGVTFQMLCGGYFRRLPAVS